MSHDNKKDSDVIQAFIDPDEPLKLAIVEDEISTIPNAVPQVEQEQAQQNSQEESDPAQQEQAEEEDAEQDESQQEQLSPEEIEALEATAAGEEGNNGHNTTFFISFGNFSQPTSVPPEIGTPGIVSSIQFSTVPFVASVAEDTNLLPNAVDDMNMDFEPLPCPCNLVVVLDISKSMIFDEDNNFDSSQLDLAKKATIEAIEKYALLGEPLNITVIPFASTFLFFEATRTEFFGNDADEAIEFIEDLFVFYKLLGPETYYDDALEEAQEVLENQLEDEALDGYLHKVLFISDAEPSDENTADDYPEWKTFIDDNNIDVVGIVIDPEIPDDEVDEAYEGVVNEGDQLIVIEDMDDIQDELVPNLPFKAIHLSGNLLENDTLGDPPTSVTSLTFCVLTHEEALFYADQVEENQSAIVPDAGEGYKVTLQVPADGLSLNTLLGGSIEVNPDGQYDYWGPAINIPTGNLTEDFQYTITDSNGDSDTADVMLVLKDTDLEAYDNARYIEPLFCDDEDEYDDVEDLQQIYYFDDEGSGEEEHEEGCPCELIENFEDESLYEDSWSSKGHEHIINYQYSSRLLLSTFNDRDHSNSDRVASENTLAGLLYLSNNALDDANDSNAKYGSAVWQDLELKAGDKICFDYNFFTNDREVSKENDYAFISIAGMGEEIVYVFSDVFDPYLYEQEVDIDGVEWAYGTGWLSDELMVPIEFKEGTYRVGFGVMDVNDNIDFSPKDKANESSMVLLDDIGIKSSNAVSGNVILDPNEDVLSEDPIGVEDLIQADGGIVTQIAFVVDDPDDYINDNDLDLLGAFSEDGLVKIPVGDEVSFATPAGGELYIDKLGNYNYLAPNESEQAMEQFEYTLSEVLGDGSDTAFLSFYFTSIQAPSQGEDEPGGTKVFKVALDDEPSQYLIADFNQADEIIFSDVIDINEPMDDPNQPDIDDVISEWAQQGNDLVVSLSNETILVFQDVGVIHDIGPTPGQTVQTFLEDNLNATVTVMD